MPPEAKTINIKLKRIDDTAEIPIRATPGSVGYDVYAHNIRDKKSGKVIGELPVTIPPGKNVLLGIGVIMAIPWPIDCEVRPRSGLASKFDIELGNSPGTVDPDYRNVIGVLLRNHGNEPYTINKGDRIAQLIFKEVVLAVFEEINSSEELPPTRRGLGGFGSTGIDGKGLGTEEYDANIRRLDKYYMKIAIAASGLSRCVRGAEKDENGQCKLDDEGNLIGQTRKFGCVIVRDNSIISQGYNLQVLGSPVCEKEGCLREKLGIPSGTQLEKCNATHAEEWAVANAAKGSGGTKGATLYVNSEPCEICAKTIVNAEIATVVLLEGTYPNNGIKILKNAGINIRYVKI